MNEMLRPLLLTAMVAGLTACGGGGGGGGSPSANDGGGAVAHGAAPEAKSGAEAEELVCSGNRCRLADGANQAVGSMYRFYNDSHLERELVVSGLSPAIWHAVSTKVSGAGVAAGELSLRQEEKDAGPREPDYQAEHAELSAIYAQKAPAQRLKLGQGARREAPVAYAPGEEKTWFDSIHENDVATTLRTKRALPGGASVHVWTENGAGVSARQADFLAERFAGSVYPLEVSLLGQPWGVVGNPVFAGFTIPADTRDVHIVVTPLRAQGNAGLMGYVWSGNALRNLCTEDAKPCQKYQRSNAALAVFLSSEVLARSAAGEEWHERSQGAGEALSTLAHEFSHLFYSYNKRYKPAVPVKVETWEDEMFAQSIAYLVLADTFGGGRGAGRDAHPDLRPRADFERALDFVPCDFSRWNGASSCYPKALALGALMVHQYGHQLFRPWLESQNPGAQAVSEGLRAAGGAGYADMLERYAGTMLSAGAANVAGRYGYPAKRVVLPGSPLLPQGREIQLPGIALSADKPLIPMDGQYDTSKQFSYIGNGIWTLRVPANSWITLTKR